MNILVGILIAAMIIGIILLSRTSSDKEEVRKRYLKELSKFLGAELQLIEGSQDAYRISFKHEGVDFTFEDLKEKTFSGTEYSRAHLKGKSALSFDLTFAERTRLTTLSKISENVATTVPSQLKDFAVFTNRPPYLHEFFSDDNMVKLISKFKNVDSRGHPVMSLEIRRGEVILSFHPPQEGLCPVTTDLQYDVPSIEGYLHKLLEIIRKLNQMADRQKEEHPEAG